MNPYPYDITNSVNPYLINTNKASQISLNGHILSAEYIWSLEGASREALVQSVFGYYRNLGFPYPKFSDDKLVKEFEKVKKVDVDSMLVEGALKNSNSSGTGICKHFSGPLFYTSRVDKGRSLLEVFNDDELLLKVLKNRMGWCTSGEDGNVRPYVFGINNDMIIQGIRSSGLGSAISQFKPAIAKYIYSKHVPSQGKVLDYSSGWGARALGAMSLDLTYYGIDPLTSEANNNILKFFNGKGVVVNGVSEDVNSYNGFEKIDLCLSSPPYFNLEQYSGDASQSYNKFSDYKMWLDNYWDMTVKNCISVMKPNAYFCLVIEASFKKYDIGKDMLDKCVSNGLRLVETYPLQTSRSHLSGKRKSKDVVKTTEAIYCFER